MNLLQRIGIIGTLGLSACAGTPTSEEVAQEFFAQYKDKAATATPANTISRQPTIRLAPALEDPTITAQERKEYPFPTQTEILLRRPKDYGKTPETEGKDPLEDRFLRPFKEYDRITSVLFVDPLFGRNQRYLNMDVPALDRPDLPFGDREEWERKQQTLALREIGKWAFEQYKKSGAPLASTFRNVDGVIERATTIGSVKFDPQIGLNPGRISLDRIGLRARVRIGPGTLSGGYEHRQSGERKESRFALQYELKF